jgi:SH3-like domain-containing protein
MRKRGLAMFKRILGIVFVLSALVCIAGCSQETPSASNESPKGFSQPRAVHAKFEPVNLRKEPDLSEPIVAQVGPSTGLIVTTETDLWLQVQMLSGERGWVMKTWVSEDIESEDIEQDQEANTGYGCWGK